MAANRLKDYCIARGSAMDTGCFWVVNCKDHYQEMLGKIALIKKSGDDKDSAEDSTEDCIIVDDRIELRDQIMQLSIKNSFPLDQFLKPEDEIIFDTDGDVFAAMEENYSVNKQGEEESSNEYETWQIKKR